MVNYLKAVGIPQMAMLVKTKQALNCKSHLKIIKTIKKNQSKENVNHLLPSPSPVTPKTNLNKHCALILSLNKTSE